jgi:hypothetical protein
MSPDKKEPRVQLLKKKQYNVMYPWCAESIRRIQSRGGARSATVHRTRIINTWKFLLRVFIVQYLRTYNARARVGAVLGL